MPQYDYKTIKRLAELHEKINRKRTDSEWYYGLNKDVARAIRGKIDGISSDASLLVVVNRYLTYDIDRHKLILEAANRIIVRRSRA